MEKSCAKKTKVALIDYGMGNLRSVARALEKSGGEVRLVRDPCEVTEADRALVFPGQGAIVDCMDCLRRTDFATLIREWIAADRPFFGVCLGLQALFEHSEEGNCSGLGIFPGRVRRFAPMEENGRTLKIPHMGWNAAAVRQAGPVLENLRAEGEDFYFVHSYHVDAVEPGLVLCETCYGGKFVSGIQRGRCIATQFHPEKSQAKGLQLYQNFLHLAEN